jgi:hypothetical protein
MSADLSEIAASGGIPALMAEVERARRAAQTLGAVVERQCRDVLDATGLHHLIDESGDGDWGLVWERLAELGAERDALAAKVAAIDALPVVNGTSVSAAALRRILDGTR